MPDPTDTSILNLMLKLICRNRNSYFKQLFGLFKHHYWGWGRRFFNVIKVQAFDELKLNSITALLPASRTGSRAITRLGFIEVGTLNIGDTHYSTVHS